MEFIPSALADDVDNTTAGAPILGVVVAENELKLLYALLREGRANGVDGVVDGIRTVNTDRSPSGSRAANAQSAVRSRTDGRGHVACGLRISEREIDITAPINGEVVDTALRDGLRDIGLTGFDGSSLGRHQYTLLHAFQVQTRIKGCGLADGQHHGRILVDGKIRAAIDGHFVLAGLKSHEIVASAIVRDGSALRTGACIGHGDLCVPDR